MVGPKKRLLRGELKRLEIELRGAAYQLRLLEKTKFRRAAQAEAKNKVLILERRIDRVLDKILALSFGE